MTKVVRCLEEELTKHIKIRRGKVIPEPTRYCRRCSKPMDADRYFECGKCNPDLGEEMSDIFSGRYDKASRGK